MSDIVFESSSRMMATTSTAETSQRRRRTTVSTALTATMLSTTTRRRTTTATTALSTCMAIVFLVSCPNSSSAFTTTAKRRIATSPSSLLPPTPPSSSCISNSNRVLTSAATTTTATTKGSAVLLHQSLQDRILTEETEEERQEALDNIEALQSIPKVINVDTDEEIAEDKKKKLRRKNKRRYQRKREKPLTEKEADQLKEDRQAAYQELLEMEEPASIWSFENLFPEPVLDETSIERDLFEVLKRDKKTRNKVEKKPVSASKLRSSSFGASSMMRVWREPQVSNDAPTNKAKDDEKATIDKVLNDESLLKANENVLLDGMRAANATDYSWNGTTIKNNGTIDFDMTRRVDAAVYGIRRTTVGDYQYDTTLMGEGAVQFRDGVRLGNPLKVNADRLNYLARKEMAHGRNEEAQEFYELALGIDPRDGRAYLGLSRIAERRRDFKLARQCLRSGIANSISIASDGQPDFGGNPFLIQALGCLEEKAGHLSEAEALYISAARSRPSHAAAWVALAQLRTRKLRQTASAGRICFQTAERELKRSGLPPNAHVYTAWAAMEYKKAGDFHRARELFQAALEVDPKCSAAYLQLGVMEADKENWDAAEKCFSRVLQFDKRNSRVLQAYAIMASKRPDGSSRRAIDLFEKALKAKPRDAGVLQAYALFVAKLGDIDAAKSLLERGTTVNKRHAPLWQAWGVLETRYGTASDARHVFQQGIWECSQLSGGQSGGYNCARLWQAWGVLEAGEGEHAAARRCFSRALDADNRNVATITAWTLMEEELGNERDSRSIFERALKQFPPGSEEKSSLWRSYELMEQRLDNVREAQNVYQRSMRETFSVEEEVFKDDSSIRTKTAEKSASEMSKVLKRSNEVEVVRWGDSLGGEVWMNNGSIEAKVPKSVLQKKNRAAQQRNGDTF